MKKILVLLIVLGSLIWSIGGTFAWWGSSIRFNEPNNRTVNKSPNRSSYKPPNRSSYKPQPSSSYKSKPSSAKKSQPSSAYKSKPSSNNRLNHSSAKKPNYSLAKKPKSSSSYKSKTSSNNRLNHSSSKKSNHSSSKKPNYSLAKKPNYSSSKKSVNHGRSTILDNNLPDLFANVQLGLKSYNLNSTLSSQIVDLGSRIKNTTNVEQKKYLHKILKQQKKIEKERKTNKNLNQRLDSLKASTKNLKESSLVLSSPIEIHGGSTIINHNLQNLSGNVASGMQSSMIDKLGGKKIIDTFTLTGTFNPSKVVTFDNIRLLYIGNLNQDQQLLNCDNPDITVRGLCGNISTLLSNLTSSNKKLTINDVYKLQVYSDIISKAIYYEGSLKQYKKGALVLGVDHDTNLVNSLDIVRSYSSYNTGDNAVLPFVAQKIDIDVLKTVPSVSGTDPVIVLGLHHGSVVGINVYPLNKHLGIPGATTYKVMKLVGFHNGCSNGYTSSLWFGNGKLGIARNKRQTLKPSNTNGIEFNIQQQCYTVF